MSKIYPGGSFELKELIHIKCTEWACKRFSINMIVSRLLTAKKKKKGIITPHPPTPGKMVAFAFLLAFSYYLKST